MTSMFLTLIFHIHLGEDFDNTILEYLVAEFKKDQGIDLSKDKLAVQVRIEY